MCNHTSSADLYSTSAIKNPPSLPSLTSLTSTQQHKHMQILMNRHSHHWIKRSVLTLFMNVLKSNFLILSDNFLEYIEIKFSDTLIQVIPLTGVGGEGGGDRKKERLKLLQQLLPIDVVSSDCGL